MYSIEMIIPSPRDVKHKTQLFRLLREILNDSYLSPQLAFKGGTYAALRGVLDRFSVDLDFDLVNKDEKLKVKDVCERIISELGFEIKDQSQEHLQYFLKYSAPEGERNTLKLEINDDVSPFNEYEKINLGELNMICQGHTFSTMFANKLYAPVGRYKKNKKIAGRDFYDIHSFFYQGLEVNKKVVEQRSGMSYKEYLLYLHTFIDQNLSDQDLFEDLNPLLPSRILKSKIKYLKTELLMYLHGEAERTVD